MGNFFQNTIITIPEEAGRLKVARFVKSAHPMTKYPPKGIPAASGPVYVYVVIENEIKSDDP